jgi:hypothetical protein
LFVVLEQAYESVMTVDRGTLGCYVLLKSGTSTRLPFP